MAVSFDKVDDGRYRLNVNGFVCPHPQLYTKKALSKIDSGDILELIFDNPSSGESIIMMCEDAGHEIAERVEDGGEFHWSIVKA